MFTRELFALPVGSPENIKAKKRAKRRVSKKGKKKKGRSHESSRLGMRPRTEARERGRLRISPNANCCHENKLKQVENGIEPPFCPVLKKHGANGSQVRMMACSGSTPNSTQQHLISLRDHAICTLPSGLTTQGPISQK